MLDMRVKGSVAITLLFVLQCLSIFGSSKDLEFFYLVQQWPAAACKMTNGCCYPPTGKPDDDFLIFGFWPEDINGTALKSCDPNNSLDMIQILDLVSRLQKEWPSLNCPSSDGISTWRSAWLRRGTCSNLDQHSYFQAALDLRSKSNLLQALTNKGIYPGGTYNTSTIREAIIEEVGYTPYLSCNRDAQRNRTRQLYQVYLCVDKTATKFIECPVFPTKSCQTITHLPAMAEVNQTQSLFATY